MRRRRIALVAVVVALVAVALPAPGASAAGEPSCDAGAFPNAFLGFTGLFQGGNLYLRVRESPDANSVPNPQPADTVPEQPFPLTVGTQQFSVSDYGGQQFVVPVAPGATVTATMTYIENQSWETTNAPVQVPTIQTITSLVNGILTQQQITLNLVTQLLPPTFHQLRCARTVSESFTAPATTQQSRLARSARHRHHGKARRARHHRAV